MTAPLIALAVQVGAPMIRAALERRFGADGKLAGAVTDAIARKLGAAPEALPALAEAEPGRVIEAIREVERETPEMVRLWMAEAEAAAALARAEETDPAWMRAWRPGGMYLIGFLWLWNTVILHVANAIWKIALPPVPFEQLIQLSGLYFGLYMGGHTIKDLAAKWQARAGAQ